MPAPIVGAVIDRLISQVEDLIAWDGEVPRQNTDGTDVVIDLPGDLCLKVFMAEGGFAREWTTEDAYSDEGSLTVQLWTIQRSTSESVLTTLEAILAKDWNLIEMPSPYYVYDFQLQRWYSGQEEGVRTKKSNLVYRGELEYHAGIHGSVPTR